VVDSLIEGRVLIENDPTSRAYLGYLLLPTKNGRFSWLKFASLTGKTVLGSYELSPL
jgi:hypothetical protein